MRIQTGQLVSLGYGRYVRSDEIVRVARPQRPTHAPDPRTPIGGPQHERERATA